MTEEIAILAGRKREADVNACRERFGARSTDGLFGLKPVGEGSRA
jgi:hypothetical protein